MKKKRPQHIERWCLNLFKSTLNWISPRSSGEFLVRQFYSASLINILHRAALTRQKKTTFIPSWLLKFQNSKTPEWLLWSKMFVCHKKTESNSFSAWKPFSIWKLQVKTFIHALIFRLESVPYGLQNPRTVYNVLPAALKWEASTRSTHGPWSAESFRKLKI